MCLPGQPEKTDQGSNYTWPSLDTIIVKAKGITAEGHSQSQHVPALEQYFVSLRQYSLPEIVPKDTICETECKFKPRRVSAMIESFPPLKVLFGLAFSWF